MKEHPINFTADEVRAYLEGRKTQARRVIKPQPEFANGWWVYKSPKPFGNPVCSEFTTNFAKILADHLNLAPCPYGQPGDSRLWVRETWRQLYEPVMGHKHDREYIAYKADGWQPGDLNDSYDGCWRPSIHMPRWASRITLEVVNIRVERVQDISEEDAKAEGTSLDRAIGYGKVGMQSYREGYINIWNSINAKRGYSWESNCWVWVIEFSKAED